MHRSPAIAPVLALALALAGCGGGSSAGPQIGKAGDQPQAAQQLGFPTFATRNTTRVGGADPVADAAAVAEAVYPGTAAATRPQAVALVDANSWQDGVAAAVLFAPPLRAPILLADGSDLPGASGSALSALRPHGAPELGGAQVIRVGAAPAPDGYKSTQVAGNNVFATAAKIDQLATAVRGKPSPAVVVASSEQSGFALPAAGWAAKSGDPVLYVTAGAIPPETRAALRTHQRPDIYVLGPPAAVSPLVERQLRRFGGVQRIAGPDPIVNAIAFARYSNGRFGWGVVDPGHALLFASRSRPLDAAAAAALSGTGGYGPLLLVSDSGQLPALLERYLLDIQPGYERDPVRGVYNHGWIVGDGDAISPAVQARIDTLLQIVPVDRSPAAAQESPAPPKRPTRAGRTSTTPSPTSTAP
jgi:hypothetical protein